MKKAPEYWIRVCDQAMGTHVGIYPVSVEPFKMCQYCEIKEEL